MKCQEAQQIAISRAFSAVRPNPPLTIGDWLRARKGVILPEKGNARPGLVDLSLTNYLEYPLQLFTDNHVERLGCCFARQLGKTTFLFVMLGYVIDYDPGSTLLFYPTQDIARSVSNDRVKPMILNTPTLAQHIGRGPDDFTTLMYNFDRMVLRYGHSGSEVSGRSHPIRYLFKDETSAMTSSAASNVDDTTSSFWNRRIVETSTPMHEDDNIWRFMGLKLKEGMKGEQLWDTDSYEPKTATTVYLRFVRCPHCNGQIQFLWRQLRWPTDVAIRQIPGQAWYQCQLCDEKIFDSDKKKMMDTAEWLQHESCRDAPIGKWVGFHLNKMYGPWDSCQFGEVAASGLRARLSRSPEMVGRFVNNTLALPYSILHETIELVDDAAIGKMVRAYHRNMIPEECKVLTIGIDVGEHATHFLVQGFGANGWSWRITWGVVADLYAMDKYLKESYFMHPTAGKMLILFGAADSRYNKANVIAFCKRFRNRIFPIQGERVIRPDPGNVTAIPYKAYKPERDDNGKPLSGSMTGYRLNTVYWKQNVFSRINCLHGQSPTFFFPEERDEELETHLRSEEEVVKRKPGSNEVIRTWQLKKGYKQNHYFDAMIYGYAIADVFGKMNHRVDGPVYTGIRATQTVALPSAPQQSKPSPNPLNFGKMEF